MKGKETQRNATQCNAMRTRRDLTPFEKIQQVQLGRVLALPNRPCPATTVAAPRDNALPPNALRPLFPLLPNNFRPQTRVCTIPKKKSKISQHTVKPKASRPEEAIFLF